MSFHSQHFLQRLQATDHGRKRSIMMIASLLLFVLVVGVWLLFFRGSKDAAKQVVGIEPDFSLWQSTQGLFSLGLAATGDKLRLLGSGFAVSQKNYLIQPN